MWLFNWSSYVQRGKKIKLPDDVEKVALDEEGKRKLEDLNKASSKSKTSNESIYSSRAIYFTYSARAESDIELEARLSYWLSWYMLPSGHEDGLNAYVYPFAIRLARGN